MNCDQIFERDFGRCFCFHVPMGKISHWKVKAGSVAVKQWVPAPEFYRRAFSPVLEEIELLLRPR
jgi:hypothetical protein